MSLIHVDVSEHQTSAFDDTYNRPFGMFRAASEWDRTDAKAPANLAWCLKARTAGKLVNFGVYVIPGNVPNDAVLGRLASLGVPNDCVIMIDAESWGGLITGDHSAQFNSLAIALKTRQGGRSDLVWGYLNPNVDAGLWPTRPSWLGFIQPAYGPSTPPDPKGLNRIGWQYCNAVQNGTTYPSSSSPFGRCDHNVMFIDYPTGDPVSSPSQWTDADWALFGKKIVALRPYDATHKDQESVGSILRYLGNSTPDAVTARGQIKNVDDDLAAFRNDTTARLTDLQVELDAIKAILVGLSTGGALSFDMTGTLTPKATP